MLTSSPVLVKPDFTRCIIYVRRGRFIGGRSSWFGEFEITTFQFEYEKLRNSFPEHNTKFPNMKVIDNFVYKRTDFSNGNPLSEALC